MAKGAICCFVIASVAFPATGPGAPLGVISRVYKSVEGLHAIPITQLEEHIPVYLILLPTMALSSGIFQEGKEKKRNDITFGAEIRTRVTKQNKECIDFLGYPAVQCHTADKPPGQSSNCKRRLILWPNLTHGAFYYSGRRSNGLVDECGLTVSNFRLTQITKKQGPFVAKSIPDCTSATVHYSQIANPVALAETPLCGYTPPAARRAPPLHWKTRHFAPSFFSNVFDVVTEEHHSKRGNQGLLVSQNSMLVTSK